MKHIQITQSESPLCELDSSRIREKMRKQFPADVGERHPPRLARVSSIDVLTRLLRIGVIGLMLYAVNASAAGSASIQGIVKDAKGQPIGGADVRIESRDGKQFFSAVKTDGKGRYNSAGLTPGVYRVSLVVNGGVKASIMNTTAKADRATQLNFDLKPTAASQASAGQKKGKHMVWMPPTTGSHMGGRWVEVDEGGAGGTNGLNIKRGSAEDLKREQMVNPQGPQNLPGYSGNGSH